MPEPTLLQLEELLRRMGSVEVSEDVAHKYALRRALLNSTRFERNKNRQVWMRLFTITTNMVVGGAIVAVLVVSVMSFELRDGRGAAVVPSGGAQQSVSVQLVEAQSPPLAGSHLMAGLPVASIPQDDPEEYEATNPFASRPAVAQFASFEIRPEVRQVLEFARPSISFAVSR